MRQVYRYRFASLLRRGLVPMMAIALGAAVVASQAAQPESAADPQPSAAPADAKEGAAATDKDASSATQTLLREGLKIEFDVSPLTQSVASARLAEADQAEVRFTVTDETSGEPVSGLYPVVWMDIAEAFNAVHGKAGQTMSCRDRVGIYLQGIVGVRPLIDLNSYFVMIMNQDPTISVIDPIIGVQGRTNLYAQIVLKRAGADWTKTDDEKRMFVSMPVADMVAVVDLEQFGVTHNILAGDNPQRTVLQRDEKYLWVGNDSRKKDESGVTVIDAQGPRFVKTIATGKGHHEIAISSGDRYAFVSNREDGTVSVIDILKLEKIKDLETGSTPIALAYSALSDALYVADGDSGEIAVIDGRKLEQIASIETGSGAGPLRFSADGRWGVTVNPSRNKVYVIDASNNTVRHAIDIEGRPFAVAFSDNFAYVRALDNEMVHMINVRELGRIDTPLVTRFPAGKAAPSQSRNLPIADMMVPAPGEASMLVASPSDLTVYYYMEGMNSPMGNFRNYGHRPRAVNVVDRTLKERKPGQYSAKVKIPAAGKYDVVFLLDTPRLLHCFTAEAAVNPMLEHKYAALAVEYLNKDRKVAVGDTKLRFRLLEPKTQEPKSDLEDVSVLYYHTSGRQREIVAAKSVGEGVYEAPLQLRHAGAYYAWVASESMKVGYKDLKYFSLMTLPKRAPAADKARDKTSAKPAREVSDAASEPQAGR